MCAAVSVVAQAGGGLRASGFVQAQYQWGEADASLKVGAPNEHAGEPFSRVGVRRGFVKLAYDGGAASGVLQVDATEKGVGIKDAYLMLRAPRLGGSALQAGVFNRPFGHEIGYSSAQRESPERSMVTRTLFPEERDVGIQVRLQAADASPWHVLALEAGLFAGNGIKPETDSRRDFIGRLSAAKTFGSRSRLSGGVSYYYGGVYQGSRFVYTMQGKAFAADSSAANVGRFAKRAYAGVDAQWSVRSAWGMTQVRAEYLSGTQPGGATDSKSPNEATLPAGDTYVRRFGGGYVAVVQDAGALPLSAVLKYDRYDPNTGVSGNDVGRHGTGVGDVAFETFGFGVVWRAGANVRLQAYYEIVRNETSASLAAAGGDFRDNVFTLRMQYIW
jgi:phosphate-selective porin